MVVVVGVLVALAVDAARDAREERAREAAYLRQLRADLLVTDEGLTEAISVDERARETADRAVQSLNSPGLPPSDSLVAWTAAATNSSASFYPTMGTVTALVESGELRLIGAEAIRQKVLITTAVWRAWTRWIRIRGAQLSVLVAYSVGQHCFNRMRLNAFLSTGLRWRAIGPSTLPCLPCGSLRVIACSH